MVKRFPDDPFCRIMASMGSINGSASGEIIVHFGVFLNSKIKIRGKSSDSGEATAGIWTQGGKQQECGRAERLRKDESGGY